MSHVWDEVKSEEAKRFVINVLKQHYPLKKCAASVLIITYDMPLLYAQGFVDGILSGVPIFYDTFD